jgi:hypothetical protein
VLQYSKFPKFYLLELVQHVTAYSKVMQPRAHISFNAIASILHEITYPKIIIGILSKTTLYD